MKERSFDEMIAYFNRRVSEMDIAQDYKMELLGMLTALGYKHEKSAQPERKKGRWISQDFNKHDGMISTAVYYYPKCSVCGHTANYTNFCPNCGTKMEVNE